MYNMLFVLAAILVSIASGHETSADYAPSIKHFVIDCTRSPKACDNDCYGIYVAKKPDRLYYDKPSEKKKKARRDAGGCKSPSPCRKNGVKPFNQVGGNHAECDEYPYASTKQGGIRPILRCIPRSDNRSEGGKLKAFLRRARPQGCGGTPCYFRVSFKRNTLKHSPYCLHKGGRNDGYEFQYINRKYVKAKNGRTFEDGFYEPHIANETDFFPPYLRREVLLSDGSVVLLLTRDLEERYEGKIFTTAEGNATVVKELLGNEKSPELRPTTLED